MTFYQNNMQICVLEVIKEILITELNNLLYLYKAAILKSRYEYVMTELFTTEYGL